MVYFNFSCECNLMSRDFVLRLSICQPGRRALHSLLKQCWKSLLHGTCSFCTCNCNVNEFEYIKHRFSSFVKFTWKTFYEMNEQSPGKGRSRRSVNRNLLLQFGSMIHAARKLPWQPRLSPWQRLLLLLSFHDDASQVTGGYYLH